MGFAKDGDSTDSVLIHRERAMNDKPYFEVWHDEGRDQRLVRCECWRHLIFDGIAVNNGWFPLDRYPHAPYCKARKA